MNDLSQTVSCVLYITDEAYYMLVDVGRRLGFQHGRDNAKGIHHYFEWIVRQQLVDNRPPEIREYDHEMLEAGMSPEWRLYSPRRRRKVTLTRDALVDASKWAMLLGIAYVPSRRIVGAPTYVDGPQCMAAVLEAVGTGWIKVEEQTDE